MRQYTIFLTLFALYSLDLGYPFIQGPEKCCFSFTNVRIPLKKIESYHKISSECHWGGVVFITKAGREICADPNERWVQRLQNLVDVRTLSETSEDFSMRWQISLPEPKPKPASKSKPDPKTAPVSEPESEQEPVPAPLLEPEPKLTLESEKEPKAEPEPKPTTVSEHYPEPEQEPKPASVPELEPELELETISKERTPCQRLVLETMSTMETTQLRLESPAHEQSHIWSTRFCRRHENN